MIKTINVKSKEELEQAAKLQCIHGACERSNIKCADCGEALLDTWTSCPRCGSTEAVKKESKSRIDLTDIKCAKCGAPVLKKWDTCISCGSTEATKK